MTNEQKRVFIVEDDEHLAKVYAVKFSQEGIATSFAGTGEGAVSRIAAEKPDLIILDLMIPRKDGFTVLEEIKKDPSLATIPVLILSNLGQSSDKKRALDLGASDYMVKIEHSVQEVFDKAKSYLGK
ncbi:MAG: hypothetical protein A2937_01295 [Candidatus Yonathbacteria bacterium RIFCSPLOWO2_01_FULL_47_33b]|uniref:Response regulatory domain-containing protein n=1 Tax=Candidatus Yonathbacteria bacterium RIFCSPLOWO2_01_FULL_47_33b TaxID=1802727 RepID=A0A1G2SGY9_9BACT|nr:MAG: hypothetical protein A2937_01295 [Candidatus Yonathbacteria bacterium RIFCSPLOWO2_01_FULL_47_33b]